MIDDLIRCLPQSETLTFNVVENVLEFAKMLKKVFPYSVVAYVCELSQTQFIPILKRATLEQGISLISIVVDKNKVNSINTLADVFSLPENVRGIIAMHSGVLSACKYIAHYRSLPLFLLVSDCVDNRLISDSALIRTSISEANILNVPCEKKVYLLRDNIASNEFIVHTIENLLCTCTCLVDYIFSLAYCGKMPNEMVSGVLRDVVCAINAVKGNDYDKLTYHALHSQIYGASIKGYYNICTCDVIFRLKNARFGAYECACVLEKYRRLFNGRANNLPNYTERAKAVSLTLGIDYFMALKGIKAQIKKYANPDIQGFRAQFDDIYSVFTELLRVYKELGGKVENSGNASVIALAGDTPFGINGMSLLREKYLV